MNIRFKSCEEPKQFYSLYQNQGHYLKIRALEDDINKIRAMMADGASVEEVLSQCKDFDHLSAADQFISLSKDQDYDGDYYLRYNIFSQMGGYSSPRISIPTDSLSEIPVKTESSWIVEKPWGDSLISLEALYITKPFEKKPIPEVFNQMVLYSECMVDTNTQIFLTDKWESRWGFEDTIQTKEVAMESLITYLNEKVFPKPDNDDWSDEAWELERKWWHETIAYIEQNLENDKEIKELLDKAFEETVQRESGSRDLELLLMPYSKSKALTLKRYRRVMGSCSQDLSPRYHAQDIAKLAAESYNWEVFLRSHLDILNDQFARASDGSYAWAARKTYLKELEELNINTLDLLIGISLLVDNPADNHYYGSVGRIGRALAETNDPEAFDTAMFTYLKNENLDERNRFRLYWLYLNYLYHLPDEIRLGKLETFKKLGPDLPPYLAQHLESTKMNSKD